ncbi:hypothetical protein ACFWWC_34130 [Streptomyces sp. NPDC058642]|uniref:hypothetical protein n=1 Tax=Streptomyces sp. NPDC058642 TaxID=3346572 RepID=UPI00365FD7F1
MPQREAAGHAGGTAPADLNERLHVTGQLGLALALLDLLDDYWVTCEIRFADRGPGGPLPSDVLWDGYRRRLEAPETADAVPTRYGPTGSRTAPPARPPSPKCSGATPTTCGPTDSPEPLLRRTRRVLECSGHRPGPLGAHGIAARLPALHD